jgi:ATP adenylyltransferase
MQYIVDMIKKGGEQNGPCVFCAAIRGRPSHKNLVLQRGRVAYIVMNKFPYNSGHLLVIPNRHLDEFTALTAAEHAEMGELLGQAMQALRRVMRPHGFNIGMNLGQMAGAGIRDHLHYHIVPRWSGDANFMPVVADIRMIYEHMEETYGKLRKCFDG